MYCNSVGLTLPYKEYINLFVFGDLQLGASGFDTKLWQSFKEEFKSTPHAYALGLGDYSDWVRPTIRERLANATSGDISVREQLDSMVQKSIREISDKLDFLYGKIIGLHSGHHDYEFLNGINTTQNLCEIFKTTYLGFQAYTVLKLLDPRSKKQEARAIKILSTHGQGNAAFTSSDMRNLESKMAPFWFAHIYLRGHSSKLGSLPLVYKDVTVKGRIQVIETTRWLINCGGFMEGYTDGKASYVEFKQLPPAARGYVIVRIRRKQIYESITNGKKKYHWAIEIEPTLRSHSISY